MIDAGGWVQIHRRIDGHPALRHPIRFSLFVRCVVKAARKPTAIIYRGRRVSLNRGQLSVSIRDLSELVGCSKKEVETAIKHLRLDGMLETDAETGLLRITVCNYDAYQSSPHERGDSFGDEIGDSRGTVGGQYEPEIGDSRGTEKTKRLQRVAHADGDAEGTVGGQYEPEIGDIEQEDKNKNTDSVRQDAPKGYRRRPRIASPNPSPEFQSFWDLYPKAVAKGHAEQAFAKARRKVEHEQLMAALMAAVAKWTRDGTELRYIPNPATWLNGERWNDRIQGQPAAPHSAAKVPYDEQLRRREAEQQATAEGFSIHTAEGRNRVAQILGSANGKRSAA